MAKIDKQDVIKDSSTIHQCPSLVTDLEMLDRSIHVCLTLDALRTTTKKKVNGF